MHDIIRTNHTSFDTAPVTDIHLVELHDRATKEKWMHMWQLEINGDTDEDHENLYKDNSRYFSAIEEGKEVGFIRLLNKTEKFTRYCDEEVWDIDSFLVLPEHRSKGVCRKMIKLVIAEYPVKMMHMSDWMFVENIDYYGSLGFTFGKIQRSDDEFDDICWSFHHSFKEIATEKLGVPDMDIQYVDDERGPRFVLSGDESESDDEASEIIRKVFGSTVELSDPPEITLQEVTDPEAKRNWISKYIKDYCPALTKYERSRFEDFWSECSSYRYFSAISNGHELGFVGIADIAVEFDGLYKGEVQKISMFYVLPEYRHKGVLREMLRSILSPEHNVKCLSIAPKLFSKHKKYFRALGFTYSHVTPFLGMTEAYVNSFKQYGKKWLRRLNWFVEECNAGRDPEKLEWVDSKHKK